MNKSVNKALSIVLSAAMLAGVFSLLSADTVKAAPDKDLKHVEKTAEQPEIEVVYETGSQNNAKTRRDDTEAIKTENDGSFDVVLPGGEVLQDENGEPVVTDVDSAEIQWEEIHIKTPEDFAEFAKNCRLDTWSKNKNVYLDNDIIITGLDNISVPTFGGHFYGCNYTINGYTMFQARSYTGLFEYVQEGACIEGLVVRANVKAEGKQMITGGIAGENRGEIRNCVFEGNVSGHNYVGGIAGYNELTGNILNCKSKGNISGAYYTGGIVGENVGNISSCVNEANVNTVMVDRASSIQDIDISSYTQGLISRITGEGEKQKKSSVVDTGSVDTGGIAGLSIGVIQFSDNMGEVGYEHVGYNVGGIVGRQSGYVHGCENKGIVKGRKDVGGITGQAEPYVVVDLTEDTIAKLTEGIDKLHDIIDTTLADAGTSSDVISSRLNIVKQFTDNALDQTSILSNSTIDWTNGMVGAGNELMSRAQYIMSETSKDGGPADNTADAFVDVKSAAGNLEKTVNDLNIYNYMNDSQRATYDESKDRFNTLTKSVTENENKYIKAAENYYIQKELNDDVDRTDDEKLYPKSSDLRPFKKAGDSMVVVDSTQLVYTDTSNIGALLDAWAEATEWRHGENPEDALIGTEEGDSTLIANAGKDYKDAKKGDVPTHPDRDDVEKRAKEKAADEYNATYGTSIVGTGEIGNTVDNELANQASEMAGVIIAITPDLDEATRKDAEATAKNVKEAAGHMEDAGRSTKSIIGSVASRGGIAMPTLGDDYRNATNALNAALQGMSDNMGALNNEMADSSDVMIDDMGDVNDQFNVIMKLYADAIDGVVDNDYSEAIEDSSMEVASTCVDATIADCDNSGKVEGDIDVAGIAGAMGIEYDFDLESDITKSEGSKLNATYQSKCVLRKNRNNSHVIAQKSYVGGICGLQEIGTILSCENYGKVKSNSSDYVGGISGKSLSYIQKSVAKCFLVGENYIGGIAGCGYNILNSYAMVEIDTDEAHSYYGAIAGDVADEGKVHYNYFVSDTLTGIDRVSYKTQAEPIDYNTFISLETTPKECQKMYVVFYIDDVEMDRIETVYGGTVNREQFPIYVTDDGTYCKWDKLDIESMTFDAEVNGEYTRYITSLASEQMRLNDQSAILVDGRFRDGDELQVTLSDVSTLPMANAVEHWEIDIPSGTNEKHLVRYKNPDNVDIDTEIYINNAGRWDKVDAEIFGAYKTFEISGAHAELAVVKLKKSYTKLIIIIAVVTVCVILLIILLIAMIKKNKKKAKALKPDETEKSVKSGDEDNTLSDDENSDIEIVNINDEP